MTTKKKRERELEKLHETEDEKRARRLAKKAAKAEKQRALLGGYSNESNPWNDASLTDQFVWSKKVDKDRTMGISSDSAEAQKRRREAQVEELKKVKRAREQREVEREQQEQERRLIERERESMAFDDNERREDEFQLQQTVLRAHIRVQEGRAKPVDVLSESLSLLRDDLPAERAFDIALQEPLAIFHGLSERELRELHADISTHAELDVERRPFWAAMIDVCAHSLDEIAGGSAAAPGVHAAVDADVAAMLSGKTGEELDALHAQIEAQLRGGDATGGAVDSDYWEVVLRRLSLARAHSTLREMHDTLRRRRAQLLGAPPSLVVAPATASAPHVEERAGDGEPQEAEERHGGGGVGGGGAAAAAVAGSTAGASEPSTGRYSPDLDAEVDYGSDAEVGAAPSAVVMSEAAGAGAGRAEEAAGRYSPPLLSALQVERAEAVEAAEDVRQLEARRARVKARMMDTRAAAEAAAAEDPLVAAEGRKGMEQGEARFSFEVPLEKKVAWWHDKYRPRKPKYFNRVHTGYEWNKYNQTHYDHDNPPPKMVQGYKFNIFYPDLIDRQRAPAYQLLPDPSGAKDTCVIRFRGGPPYEDLAFKIVNREWEHSHKRGFKCRFERGILQLYFNFKRVRYRR